MLLAGRRLCAPGLRSKWCGPVPGLSLPASPLASRGLHVLHAKGDDDEEPAEAGKPLRVERVLANLGYGKRRDCQGMVQQGRVRRLDGSRLKVGEKALHADLLLDGEPLDPPFPLTVALNKPVGYVVTSPEDEKILDPKVYDLLPQRYGRRRPFLAPVGRLDKDTSGLLLLTDDGQLLHRIKSPKAEVWKLYEAVLAEPMGPKEAEVAARRFASGAILLKGDVAPLLPAKLIQVDERTFHVSICEGRYHQVRRMFTSLGCEVVKLHRLSVGGLMLARLELPLGEYCLLSDATIDSVFQGPSSVEVLGLAASSRSSQLGDRSSSSSSSSRGEGLDKHPSSSSSALSSNGTDSGERSASGERRTPHSRRDQHNSEQAQAEPLDVERGEYREEEGEEVPTMVLMPASVGTRKGGRRKPGQRVLDGRVIDGDGDGDEMEEEEVPRRYREGARMKKRKEALKKIVKMGG